MKMTSNMKTNEDALKNEDILKNCPPHNNLAPPPSYYDITWIFLKTSHLNSRTTNDVKPEMLSGVKTRNKILHYENNVRSIAHVRAYIKDNIFMQRRLVQMYKKVGARN